MQQRSAKACRGHLTSHEARGFDAVDEDEYTWRVALPLTGRLRWSTLLDKC